MSSILDRVDTPADLKGLDEAELGGLSEDVRKMIIDTVSKTGGHLASSLGVVELTVALLKVFDPPEDLVLWDVGHQAYAWKILTGRRDRFGTLRQKDGISGFTKRSESEYDSFGAGHSGTALSAGLGMAVARDRRRGKEHVVAVLGDGACGCGISYEAMINVHSAAERLIVVLNDNEMSIAANVGAMSRYLGSLLANPRYNRWKRSVENVAVRMRMGWLRKAYYKVEESVKGLFLRSVIFEELGLRYIGPIDGHNIHALVDALKIAKDSDRPIILHVATKKGKGFAPAEAEPEKWHGAPPFNADTGEISGGSRPGYSEIFGQTMLRLAAENSNVVAITAAMPLGTGLSDFAERYPDRFFDVGICEEHAVVFAAGMAARGLTPVFAVYSTFIQRSVDCIIHDICLQNLPVVICLDRAGVVGDDGPTHHGVFDISLLRPVPGLVIAQPKDETELANMLCTAVESGKPTVIRYPKASGPGRGIPDVFSPVETGRAEVISPAGENGGPVIWIWALGDMLPLADQTAVILRKKGFETGVVNARFIRPLDGNLLLEHADGAAVIITIENGVVTGGFGCGVEEFLSDSGTACRVLKFGWPDEFIPHGKPGELMASFGLTPGDIAERTAREVRGIGGD